MRFNLTRVTKLSMYYSKNAVLAFSSFASFIGFSQISTQSFLPEKDAVTVSYTPNDNLGSLEDIGVLFMTISSNNFYAKSALKFDISTIPSNAIIVDAELKMRLSSGQQENINFYVLTEDWDESVITWANFPDQTSINQFNETPSTSTIGSTGVIYHHFQHNSLKNIVQNWIINEDDNFGLVIEQTSTFMNNAYSSREAPVEYYFNPNVTIDPKPLLIVEYVMPIEIELSSINHSSTTNTSDGSITISASQGDQNYTYQWYNSSGNAIGTNSPSISGLGYGWYGVKVTDGLNNQSYMSFIVGVECETVSISYNPGPNYFENALAAAISNGSSNNEIWAGNFESLAGLRINLSGWSYHYRSLFRFLLELDDNLTVNKAQLELKGFGDHSNPYSESNAVRLKLVEGNWNIIDSYSNFPNVSAIVYAEIPTTLSGNDNASVNVKSFFDGWKNTPNNGWSMEMANSGTYIAQVYRSTHYVDSDYWPFIEFEVSIPCRYAELSDELPSGYYRFLGSELYLSYNKNYLSENGQLNYTVYNEGRVKQTSLTSASVEYGDNRIKIDISSLNDGIYVLEVINEKNRKYYFRFQKGF